MNAAANNKMREILSGKNKRSASKISDFLNELSDSIKEQGNPNQTSLFEGAKPAELLDIIKSAREKVETGGQQDLFADVEEQQKRNAEAVKVLETAENEEKINDEDNETATNDEERYKNAIIKPDGEGNYLIEFDDEIKTELKNNNEFANKVKRTTIGDVVSRKDNTYFAIYKERAKSFITRVDHIFDNINEKAAKYTKNGYKHTCRCHRSCKRFTLS